MLEVVTLWIAVSMYSFATYLWQYSQLCFTKAILWTISTPFHLILLSFLILIVYYSSVTYDKTVDITEGYDFLRLEAKKRGQQLSQLVEEANNSRDMGELPPLYPNGWIPLIESKDLAIGQIIPINALGRQFVIFRGKTGKSFILDAYCPHLGANLGVCGKVNGDCIQCPFHSWEFSGHDGSCVKVPFTNKVPEFAKIKTWLSIEQNGFIYVWHHAEDREPWWKPPIIPEIEQGLWNYKGRIQHTINCHIQEIVENGADRTHFSFLHKVGLLVGRYMHLDNWYNFIDHIFSTVWSSDQHISTIKIKHHATLFRILLLWSQATINVKQIGPAIFHTYVNSILGKGVYIQCITPEGPLRQKFVQQFYSPHRFSKILGRIYLLMNKAMVERDIQIWNNKKHLKNPLFVSEDNDIKKHRKWYSQFYSESSPRFSKKTLNW